ncbi:MAG: thymidine phosphorylase [Planctomycetes bacterium]|nr:thymidine phosphorylase [Planctomycetota bacterium]MCB9905988.1 thymidine phosphorylase [Planctomycetota bacterium]
MDARSVIVAKRDGRELSAEQIRWFIDGYVADRVAEYQAAALAMAIFLNGMAPRELEAWMKAMLHSGKVLSFPELDRPKVDKHSTGGVGDKVSIPLAPAMAACGLAVPMISGRGLGHTGGTLDKLEAIPGMHTGLDEDAFRRTLTETGLAFGAQTKDIVPADRKLYALRDVTGTVESIPLIASSIMSKKLAEGLDGLVLDVKFGSGAFITDVDRGAELARVMIGLAGSLGVKAAAYQTSMAEPLGVCVGHALEIEESLACLRGEGPDDLRELVLLQGGEALVLGGICDDVDAGRVRIAASLADGSAMEHFERVIAAQGAKPGALQHLARTKEVHELRAPRSGVLEYTDLRAVGGALVELGGGRRRIEDEIDPAVGFEFPVLAGASVSEGDLLARVHHQRGRGLEDCLALLDAGLRVTDAYEAPPLVLGRVD